MRWLVKPDILVFSPNMSWLLAYEADVIAVNRNLRMTEYEIKISRNDFKADFCKAKHIRVCGSLIPIFKHDWLKGRPMNRFLDEKRPNRFYFVTPVGLLSIDEIPDHTGLIEIDGDKVVVTKRAPELHKIEVKNDLVMEIARNSCIKLSSNI